jgi:hypothetical protein
MRRRRRRRKRRRRLVRKVAVAYSSIARNVLVIAQMLW